ncbi:hypothetical protein, partial [Sulfitobacter geojensis]|uniref:hypothetical protein n=1 Tax=Sulfitobacter geojensis TaxID=1342299 RepID=UPI00248FB7FE
YLFPHLFFSIPQYPYFWVSGKQGAVQGGTTCLLPPYKVSLSFDFGRDVYLEIVTLPYIQQFFVS